MRTRTPGVNDIVASALATKPLHFPQLQTSRRVFSHRVAESAAEFCGRVIVGSQQAEGSVVWLCQELAESADRRYKKLNRQCSHPVTHHRGRCTR